MTVRRKPRTHLFNLEKPKTMGLQWRLSVGGQHDEMHRSRYEGESREENKRMLRLASLLVIIWALFMCVKETEIYGQSAHLRAFLRQEAERDKTEQKRKWRNKKKKREKNEDKIRLRKEVLYEIYSAFPFMYFICRFSICIHKKHQLKWQNLEINSRYRKEKAGVENLMYR